MWTLYASGNSLLCKWASSGFCLYWIVCLVHRGKQNHSFFTQVHPRDFFNLLRCSKFFNLLLLLVFHHHTFLYVLRFPALFVIDFFSIQQTYHVHNAKGNTLENLNLLFYYLQWQIIYCWKSSIKRHTI